MWIPEFDWLPPLTDSEVAAGARPGESWEEARARLQADRAVLPPRHIDDDPGADYGALGSGDEGALWEASGGLEGVTRRAEQVERLRAYQLLSPRAQMEQWLSAQGRTWPDPDEVLGCPSLTTLVAVGMEWTASAARMPDEDRHWRLSFLVWCPRDPGWLTACRYRDGWERLSDGSLISGVTLWRIARRHEAASRATTPAERRKLTRMNPKNFERNPPQ